MSSVFSFWSSIAGKLQIPEDVADRRWKEIEKSYSSPMRRYHNLQHIQNMISLLDEVPAEADSVMGLAIIYHDLVYNTLRKNNEERSANIACSRMKEYLSESDLIRLKNYILATKTHTPGDPLQNLLVDLDLSILGSTFPDYKTYSRQIRVEYIWCPSFLYKKGRISVLEQFLTRNSIYQTDYFRIKYEEQARNNLKLEIESLKTD